jgi:hypothetical protein
LNEGPKFLVPEATKVKQQTDAKECGEYEILGGKLLILYGT